MWPQLRSFGSIFIASSGNTKATLGRASVGNSEMLLLFGLSRQLFLWLIQMSLSAKLLIILEVCYHQFLFVFFSKLLIKHSALVFEVWSWTSCTRKTREGNWARRNPADDFWATITSYHTKVMLSQWGTTWGSKCYLLSVIWALNETVSFILVWSVSVRTGWFSSNTCEPPQTENRRVCTSLFVCFWKCKCPFYMFWSTYNLRWFPFPSSFSLLLWV